MNHKLTLTGVLLFLSGVVGYQVGLSDLAGFAHDEFTIIRKNLDKSCLYDIYQNTLIAVCPKKPK
ncbi:hypothetical protein EE88_21605 [Salmonella enterica]|nr:hypothetical protein [Salmonella enterica]